MSIKDILTEAKNKMITQMFEGENGEKTEMLIALEKAFAEAGLASGIEINLATLKAMKMGIDLFNQMAEFKDRSNQVEETKNSPYYKSFMVLMYVEYRILKLEQSK